MKQIFLMVALLAAALVQNSFAQNAAQKEHPVLSSYYSLRDALIQGKADIAAAKALSLKNALNDQASKSLSENTRSALLKDAERIAASKNVNAQREAFADVSATLADAAKTEKLSTEAVYQLYCPMKKSYWLSREKVIKNPYYGAGMLSCGKVIGTL